MADRLPHVHTVWHNLAGNFGNDVKATGATPGK
jgi:hypothetical protein